MNRVRRSWRVVVLLAAAVALAGAAALISPVSAQAPAAVKADAQFRVKAFDEFTAMRKASPFKDLQWQFIGPTNISGRVVDIAVANRKGRTRAIYVATAAGSLWKTENEGTTFEPVFEQVPSAAGGDVAVAPSDPNIVWYGTGEANIFRSSNAGVGVYKSTDGGKTWQHMGLANTHTIPRIVIHPTSSGHRLRGRGRTRVDRQRGARRLQDHRRRQDLEQGALRRREDRRERPRDGSRGPERALRDDVAARPAEVERPAHRGRLHRQRHPQDHGRRQDVEADQHRAPGRAGPRPHRHRRLPRRSRTCSTRSWTTTRSRARRSPASSTPTAARRRARSRAPRSTGPTTRG